MALSVRIQHGTSRLHGKTRGVFDYIGRSLVVFILTSINLSVSLQGPGGAHALFDSQSDTKCHSTESTIEGQGSIGMQVAHLISVMYQLHYVTQLDRMAIV